MIATRPRRGTLKRPNMRRAVILFPSGLTLGNLFFGVFAIIAASRLEFTTAGVYVLLGGICDALDGRVARATNAGTQFGEELDSLVDAITFGLAPGMIMYFAVLNRDGWDWIPVFLFSACAVMRLARFNIEQAGTAKTYFQGLPSPAAGITLASYYWFSQSSLYTYGAVGDLPWHSMLRILMALLAFLMISNVPYPAFPRTGFRSLRAIGATVLVVGSLALLLTRKLEFFFPCALLYVAWGLARWVFGGLFERRQPTLPYDLSEGEDDEEEDEDFELADSQVHASRQGYRDTPAASPSRLDRPERSERSERPERGPRERTGRAERPERSERPERGARPERAAAAAPDAARSSPRDIPREKSRDKTAERPKRQERPERPERTARGDRPERPERSAIASAAPTPESPTAVPASGVAALTLDPGAPTSSVDGGTESSASAAASATAPTSSASAGDLAFGTPAVEGAPTRKRKRRRRRGDRKERTAGDRDASDRDGSESGDPVDDSGVEGDVGDGNGDRDRLAGRDAGEESHEQSPYAQSEPPRTTDPIQPAE
jgi:CDP-diacylglycerol--serine O-phosphatidyltransferase